MTIKLGIIGVGQIGKHHLDRYQQIPDAEVVAVADLNIDEAKRVAANFNIPYAYQDFRELLNHDEIVAVDVALHNNLHMPVTVEALEAGKHVYCEKPMAGSYIDAKKMWETAQATGRHLSIQLAWLFRPETRAAKVLIDAGKLGRLYHARSTGFRRRGRPYVDGYGSTFFVQQAYASGGALYDMGVYHIAQILYLLGNPTVKTVTGNIFQEIPMDEERRQTSNYDVEELGVGYIRFEDNITMDLIESWAINLDRFEGSSIVGSLGGIRVEPFGFFHSVGDLDLNSQVDLDSFERRVQLMHPERADAYASAQHHWIAALEGRVPLLPTAEVALNTMLISEGVYLAHAKGKEVTADEILAASQSTAIKL